MIARPAHAFGPDAVAAVAARLAHMLPAAAAWTPTADRALAAALDARLAAEATDPEAFAELHRFDCLASASPAATAATDPRGGAVAEFTAAVAALSTAFTAP